jgi:hypothetical protein
MRISTQAGYALAAVATVALAAAPTIASANVAHGPLQPGAFRPSLSRVLPPSVLIPRVARQLRTVSGPVGFHQTVSPDARKSLVYSCHYYGSDCRIWNASGTQIGQLTATADGMSNPQGTDVGAKGHWYIANTGASNLPEYTVGGASLIQTLSAPGLYPVDVATHPKGIVESNIYTTSFTAGSACVYNGASTTASYCLSDSNAFEGLGVTYDKAGNCYWSYNDNSGIGQIDMFAKCAKGASPVNLGLTLGFAGGIAFDGADNLWYSDQLAGVYKCNGTSGCALAVGGFSDGLMINFNKGWKKLYVADAGAGNIDVINPGNNTSTVFASPGTTDPPFGVAASPNAKF